MVKQAIAIGSLLAGGTTIGVATYLDSHPPTGQRQAPPTRLVLDAIRPEAPVLTPASIDLVEPTPEVAPALPTEPKPIVKARVRAKPKPPVATELVPCSDWREVGAAIIQEGGAVGSRTVRMLCSRPIEPVAEAKL